MYNLVYDCGFTDMTTISVNGKCTGDRESIPLLVISCFFYFPKCIEERDTF